MSNWFVVQTQTHSEEKAAHHLRRQGFGVYLPRYCKRRRHARRTDWVKRPLFPSYLFVRMDPEQSRWRTINSTIGVRKLVCHGDCPAPVPEGVVDEITAREDENGLVRTDRLRPFREGEALRIATGAFRDRIGLFECKDDNDRVTLLLDLLGRRLRVRVPLAEVEAPV